MSDQKQKHSTPKVMPNITQGVGVIDTFNCTLDIYVGEEFTTKKQIREYFQDIFRSSIWEHLAGKYDRKQDFAPFYLNLDDDSQRRLLHYFMDGVVPFDLEHPVMEGWEDIVKEHNIPKEHPEYSPEFVRFWNPLYHFGNEWDLNSHALLFVRKWMLFVNNTPLDATSFSGDIKQEFDSYYGEKFGCWKNWNKFWEQASVAVQEVIANHLITYN